MENVLISEINEIRKKMGLTPLIIFEKNEVAKNSRLLLEGDRDDVVRGFLEVLGIQFAKNLDEVRLEEALKTNPVTVKIPIEGSKDLEDVVCRSIDDLISAANKTMAVKKIESLEIAIKTAVNNNPSMKVEFGNSLAKGDFNKTVDDFISLRNDTRSRVTTPVSVKTTEQKLQQQIVDKLNERLGDYDEVVSRTTDDLNKTTVGASDYTNTSSGNYKLTDDLAPVGREGDESYFSNMSKEIQDRINEIQQLQEANKGFFASLRDLVNTSSIKNKDSLIKQVDAAERACNEQAQNTITNLKSNKSKADDLSKASGEQAKQWLKDGIDTETQNKVYTGYRIGVEVLGLKNRVSAAVLEFLDKTIKNVWQSFRKATSKSYEIPKDQIGMWKRLANRYDSLTRTSVSFFEDLIRLVDIDAKDFKSWMKQFGEKFIPGVEASSRFTFDETSQRVKGILNRMLELSKDIPKANQGKNFVVRGTNYKIYNTEMSNLLKELNSVMRNTSSNRFYGELDESGKVVDKLQKLQDLASKFEETIKEMSDANIPGGKELYTWYSEAVKTDGDISTFFQLAKWLDEGAENTMLNGYSFTLKGVRINFNLVEDALPIWNLIKGSLETIGNKMGFGGGKTDNLKFEEQFKEFLRSIPGEIKTKFGNVMTYGHFTNAKDIERIFAIHGPIRGAFTMAVRETLMHTVLIGTLETVRQGAFYLDRAVCSLFDDKPYDEAETCITNTIISAYETIGDVIDKDSFRIAASELNDRVRADLSDVMNNEIVAKLTNYQEYIILPLFNDSAIFAKQFFQTLGYVPQYLLGVYNKVDITANQAFELYLDGEISTFKDTYGEMFTDLIDYVIAVNSNPQEDYVNSRAKEIQEKWLKEKKKFEDTGYLYSTATGTEAAQTARENEIKSMSSTVDVVENLGMDFFPSSINNSEQVDLDGGGKIGLKDGFFSILNYPDEPTGKYTFKDGSTHDFTIDPNDGFIVHNLKAADWFKENNKIGINDFIDGKFYKIYPRYSLTDAQLKNYYDNKRLNIIDGQYIQVGDNPYSTGRIYVLSPDGQYLYDLGLVDKIISIDRIKELIKTDDKKRRLQRVSLERKQKTEEIEKTTGAELKKLMKNLEYLNTEIEKYEDNDMDEQDDSYFSTYIRMRMMRDGTKDMCNDVYYGKILKEKLWCKSGKYWDPIDGKYVVYENLFNLIDKKEKEYNSQYSKVESEYDDLLNERKKLSKFSNLINEFIYKNNMENIMKKRIQRISFLNETKRFDEDDYKHWKDTFKFQAIDEKNPGRYKDVKINMEDVMDRIDHFRKKYDEDDAFVRAVVDTHENVVRFMFTRDLANIKEGYEPSGFAKILLQLRESRGEMEIWSVSRPASGNWFLVKGDFTPKELAGMDLEKKEPADKEPKKKENPVKTFKKKEDDAGQKLKNNEKDGIDELPKNVQMKLKQKFGRGWTTEEPSENLKPYYSKSSVNSVFGDDIEIYKLNANDDFFDFLQKFSSNVEIKRGFCRALQLSKNKEGITPQQKRVITHTLGICNNKFDFNLGLTIREPKK